MDLTVDAFHALARSSPWRWRSLHFRHRGDHSPDGVEAWIARPGRMWTRSGTRPPRLRESGQARADDLPPVLRPDGLVGVRPDDWPYRLDDPLYSYLWVAMLDPQELSHHVAVSDLESNQRHGRETWWATVRALEGYEARCPSCCDLLWGGAEAAREHVVGLDVQTGVLVSLSLVAKVHRTWFIENEILAVDDDVVLTG